MDIKKSYRRMGWRRIPKYIPKSIEELDFSVNKLFHIKEFSFRGFDKLLMLNLSQNVLIELQDHAFDGLNNLLYLDISYNRLTSMTPGRSHPGLSEILAPGGSPKVITKLTNHRCKLVNNCLGGVWVGNTKEQDRNGSNQL